MKTISTAILLFFSPLLFAATKTWTGNTSTAWATASNWNGSTLPASGDDIIIPTNPSGGRMPTISANYTVKSITIQTGATLTHTGGTLSIIGGDLDVTGTYAISGGTLLTDNAILVESGGSISQSGGIVHTANAIGTDPSDHLDIDANGNYLLSAGDLEVKDFKTTAGSPNGTFTQSGGTLRVYHDYRNKGTHTSTGGTVEFAGNGGAGSFPSEVSSSNTQFHHVVINSGVDPKFDNQNISFNVSGNWTNNSSSTMLTAKTTTVVFNGSADQSIGGSQNTVFRNLTVDKADGILSLNRDASLTNGNLVVSGGTLNLGTYTLNRSSSGGTFSVANGATVRLAANTGGQTGSNFPLNFTTMSLGSTSTIRYNGDQTITQTVYAGVTYGHLTLTNGNGSGTAAKITTGNITVNGDLSVGADAILTPGASTTVSGSGTLTGNGTAQVTRTTATADFNTQYSISSKSLSGMTIDYFATGAQTVNAHNYFNLTISGSRGTNSVTLASSGTIGISGVFTPSASFSSGSYIRTGSTVEFNGGSAQNIPAFTFNNLTISNSAKTATGVLNINGAFTLSSCVLTTTATNYLNIANNGTTSGAGLTAYVNGPVRKTGDDAFTFPVGKSGTGYMPIAISAPSVTTDAFTAEYMRSSGTSLGGITASGLYRVSNCDYWNLDRTTGSSSVNVTLSWNGYSNCNAAAYVSDLASLTVAHFNGTYWDSHGKNSTTGNASNGTVTRNNVSTFSPFAIGSTSDLMNPLPLQFTLVKASRVQENSVKVEWNNSSEEFTANYIVERSADARSFEPVGQVAVNTSRAAGENYTFPDTRAGSGTVFYRVKAVGANGQYVYSTVVKVTGGIQPVLSVYPNPSTGKQLQLSATGLQKGLFTLQLFDIMGNLVQQQQFDNQGSSMARQYLLPAGSKPGLYQLLLTGPGYSQRQSLLLQ